MVSVGGEAAGYFSGNSDWNDAVGSFKANLIGIGAAIKDCPQEALPGIVINGSPTLGLGF